MESSLDHIMIDAMRLNHCIFNAEFMKPYALFAIYYTTVKYCVNKKIINFTLIVKNKMGHDAVI
jgi:hypothetical protein